jgi:hypothetical protein
MTPLTTHHLLGTALLLCSLTVAPGITWGQTLRFEEVGTIAGPVDFVRAEGKYVFTSTNKTLSVFDLSNPSSAKRTADYTFIDRVLGFRASGKFVYVAEDLSGLAILEVSDSGTLMLRALMKTPGSAKNVAISGHMAIVADQVAGLDFVDVSDPGMPRQLGSLYLDGFAADVTAAGSFAYAVDRPNGLYVADLTKLDAAEPTGSARASISINGPLQVEIVQNSAGLPTTAVRAFGPQLLLFDVSNPAKPIERAAFRTPGRPVRVSAQGTSLYVAGGAEGLQVVDLSDPSNPRIAASYKTASPAIDVTVSGTLVVVATRGAGVSILQQIR